MKVVTFSGNFGIVYKGMMNGKVPIAIKMLSNDITNEEQFLQEANTMKTLRHDKVNQSLLNIISYILFLDRYFVWSLLGRR